MPESIGVPNYTNEEINGKIPSIIAIMITGVFSPGQCPDTQKEEIGDYSPLGNICKLYDIFLVLLVLVMVSVPIMLFTVPCTVLCAKKQDRSEINQLEMADIDERGINDSRHEEDGE